MRSLSFPLLAALLAGCVDTPADEPGPTDTSDADGDGFTSEEGDCDDGDSGVHPDSAEVWYDGVDQDCDGNDDDQDGDGFDVASDCGDTDASVNPDATEVCDERDNDCDGQVDVGATDAVAVWADADGDGYGAEGTETLACAAGDGWATQAGDCDDGEPTVHTGAEEICDDFDNDCDGEVNEGNPDEVPYYRDADADGFGDAADIVLSCATPPGYVSDATDCDDTLAEVNPGAEEYCDAADRDCDGDPGNDPVDGTAYYADADGDGFGDAATGRVTCEAVEGAVTDGTDCDDGDAAARPGGVEVCDGVDNDCSGGADDGLLFSDWYPDGDGDGYGEPTTGTSACAQPEGAVADATDCDDGDARTYPDADELCDLEDNDCDGVIDDAALDERAYYADTDGDGFGDGGISVSACGSPAGYVDTDGDCDDADAEVNPSAVERCNGRDDDCDTTVDQGAADATAWYADADGDGYGDPDGMTDACDAPAGHVTAAGDCDDGSATVNPGAAERCDGVDDDCDGAADEDDAVDATSWYIDGDGDGYGDPVVSVAACAAPDGYVADGLDCDDADARVSPIDVEVCNGGDDDCDGAVDEPGALGETTWYADADADGYGLADASASACDAPAGYAAAPGDCDDASGTSYPGASELEDLLDNDCDGDVDEDFIGTGDVIVSEVTRQARFGASATNATGQWFELHNTTSRDIDLSGWYITRYTPTLGRDGFYVDPAEGLVVAAGAYVVFCKTDDWTAAATSASTLLCDYVWSDETASSSYSGTYRDNTFTLQRDAERLQVYYGGSDTTGTLIDEVAWYYDATNGYWPRDATRSLNLDPASLDASSNDAIGSWCSTVNSSAYRWYYVSTSNAEYGTPGAANYDCP